MVEKYLITAAQASYWPKMTKDGTVEYVRRGPVASLNEELYGGLEKYCENEGAELIVLPMPGKDAKEVAFHESVLDVCNPEYLNKRLNSNVMISDMKVPPQNIDPTTGRTRFAQNDRTMIFAHPKQRFKAIPSSNRKLPKLLLTTGAVTHPNYHESNNRGDVARRDHTYGAVVVEVMDDNLYNVRIIKAQKNGKFNDLGMEYCGRKRPKRGLTEALIMGDLHVGDTDQESYTASLEQIQHFKPKNLFLHDVFNGHSVNPHERHNNMTRSQEWNHGRMSLREELEQVYVTLRELSETMGRGTVYVVRSNHDEFLDRYLERGEWVKEPWNAELAMMLGGKLVEGLNPLEEGLKTIGKIPKNIKFLGLRDDMKIWGYQLASHGHKGNSGARSSSSTSRETAHGGRSITGHSHTPEILRDTYIVGTNTTLELPYTYGSANSWMHANAVIYNGGQAQMIPMINGMWHSEQNKSLKKGGNKE